MLNNPLVTRAHFYTEASPVSCALRSEQPGHLNVRAVLRRVAPHKGLHPLHRLRIYPRELCSGNNLLSAGSYRRKVGKIPYRQPGRLLRSRRSFSYPIHPFYLSGGMHHVRNGNREAKSREDLCPARRERPAHGGRQ